MRATIWLTSGLSLLFFASLAGSESARAQWTAIPSSPNASTCLLLTDGTVMCQAGEQTKSWQRLTPDQNGKYASGNWTALQDLPQPSPVPPGYGPLYYASAVLPDGRVFVIGGEYNNGYLGCATPPPPVNNCPTTLGYVFDPTANGGTGQWAGPITVPAGYGGSDNQSIILKDGTVLIADVNSGNIYQLDATALTLTLVNASGKLDGNDEEGWIDLPDGTVLTVDANNTANVSTGGGTAYEIYDPTTLSWSAPGYTPVNLADITATGGGSKEVGPSILRPDGTVIWFGGNPSGQNATYSTLTKTWTTAATFPLNSSSKQLTVADGPASILPDGNVLVETSPGVVGGKFGTGGQFFEFDTTGALNPVTASGPSVSGESSFKGRMLALPSGEILYTHGSNDVYLYTNSGSPQNAWRPVITSAPGVLGLGNTYPISGNLFNGVSMGGAYGDDAQTATNYPLVRITNNVSSHVFYARTHGHSRMGVEAVGDASVISTNFEVPPGMEQGASELVVVTNGIPSANFDVNVEPASSIAFTSASATTSDYNDPATVQAVLTAGGSPLAGKTVTFVLGSGGSAPTCSAMTDGSGVATCSLTPNQPAGPQTLTATFASDSSFAGSSASTGFTVTHEEAALAFTALGSKTSDYDDATQVQAQLTTDGAVLPSKTVTFVLGSGVSAPTCSAVTDGTGNATCTLTPNQPAGPLTLAASFAGDAFYVSASAGTTFTVTKEQDTLAFTATSPTVIANGHPATFSAVLKEDGVTPIVGRTVSITLGSGVGAQTCTGTTDATGTATCTIPVVNQPLGPNSVTANFAGDGFYLPSSATEPVILFAFLAQGSMIVGNLNAAPGTAVEFWGAQWAKDNSLSGGSASSAFKGFAETAPQSCGGGWSSDPGNSSGPPASVPSYMGVIASSSVSKSGSAITGNVPGIIVVKTNGGYGPSPGHSGTGTVVATFCP
jgi:Bacterial Ig-like domain (group 3)